LYETFQNKKYQNQSAFNSLADGGRNRLYSSPILRNRCVIIFNIMGQITIEIPQSVNRTYRVVSETSAKRILSHLDKMVKQENSVEDDEILGLWANREESVEEISQKLRKGWDRTKKNG
jgi:hypothetical protein